MKVRKSEGEKISIKISGKSLKQLIAIRSEREMRTGKIVTMTEIVREAIGMLSERGGSDESCIIFKEGNKRNEKIN